MIATANNFAAADDDMRGSLQATNLPKKNNGNGKRKNPPDDQGRSEMVAMTFQRAKAEAEAAVMAATEPPGGSSAAPRILATYKEYRDMPFLVHLDENGKS